MAIIGRLPVPLKNRRYTPQAHDAVYCPVFVPPIAKSLWSFLQFILYYFNSTLQSDSNSVSSYLWVCAMLTSLMTQTSLLPYLRVHTVWTPSSPLVWTEWGLYGTDIPWSPRLPLSVPPSHPCRGLGGIASVSLGTCDKYGNDVSRLL